MLQLVSAHVLSIELAAEWYHYIRYISSISARAIRRYHIFMIVAFQKLI